MKDTIVMLIVYPWILIKELFMQKLDFFDRHAHSTIRMINGLLMVYGGIGLVLYTGIGYAIYKLVIQ
jgi:hypothetical protein